MPEKRILHSSAAVSVSTSVCRVPVYRFACSLPPILLSRCFIVVVVVVDVPRYSFHALWRAAKTFKCEILIIFDFCV